MAADQGDGAVDLTAFTQRLAEVLGLPVDDVRRGVMRALPRLSLRDLTARHVTAALDEAANEMPDVRDLTRNGSDLDGVHRWLRNYADTHRPT